MTELDRLIEADISDPTLSRRMNLIAPDNDLDWEEWEQHAEYCNRLYLYWKTLTPAQKEAVDRFTAAVWNREYSFFVKHLNHRLQTDKECREYKAPLVEYEEDWSDD
jgi:hypothetical protein